MDLLLSNVPAVGNDADRAVFHSRVSNAVNGILSEKYNVEKPRVSVIPFEKMAAANDKTVEPRQKKEDDVSFVIEAREPQYSFDQIVLEEAVLKELRYSIQFERVRDKVYLEWGLSKIEPCPKLALNFHGESGTGKTMAAHGIADAMKRKIILASYAEIESKYHGDGPKNVKKLFQIAADANAVLFIDEADSLLSKRLTNVTQGSEQAINSMRSQLLIQIEQFSGVVIFATNLASNYDSAFVTRIKSIKFEKPNKDMRKKLWEIMLLPGLPLDNNLDVEKLALIDDVCGRDIKNAVVKAAIQCAIDNEPCITEHILEETLRSIIESNRQVTGRDLSETERLEIGKKVSRHLRKKNKLKRGFL
jgi:ATP-dependent 26S proteasome regulatory subunit